ncbi:uncharacterized protein LOC129582019 [Paramacrobiotus metropolitanus]|uniref:uncharacterized protein LOC129582019 n=1 Tax=Paramacrobiotus metropolitanus TaxID=2943436 RepID=UPI00244575CF|nr:uncharacterized protein LOC129582019 [Paramacrobiotus metropolitanus]
MKMTFNYCPSCLKETESVEQYFASGPQLLCGVCDAIIEDSPICNPDSPGSGEQYSRQPNPDWSGLCSSTKWNCLAVLKQEDSQRGQQYRKTIEKKQSILYRTICDSIESTASKLNLDALLIRQIQNKYEEVRAPHGVVGARNRRHIAPALGVACILWVCRQQGLDLPADRLAAISEVKKKDLLGALMYLEKRFGFPANRLSEISPIFQDRDLEADVQNLKKSLTEQHFDEADTLMKSLSRLRIIPDSCTMEGFIVCAFYLMGRKKLTKKNSGLKGFCKTFGLECSRRLEAVKDGLDNAMPMLVAHLNIQYTVTANPYWISHVRDFVTILNGVDANEVPQRVLDCLKSVL